jgi:hypothetical protein
MESNAAVDLLRGLLQLFVANAPKTFKSRWNALGIRSLGWQLSAMFRLVAVTKWNFVFQLDGETRRSTSGQVSY